jgi:hypothetical protein
MIGLLSFLRERQASPTIFISDDGPCKRYDDLGHNWIHARGANWQFRTVVLWQRKLIGCILPTRNAATLLLIPFRRHRRHATHAPRRVHLGRLRRRPKGYMTSQRVPARHSVQFGWGPALAHEDGYRTSKRAWTTRMSRPFDGCRLMLHVSQCRVGASPKSNLTRRPVPGSPQCAAASRSGGCRRLSIHLDVGVKPDHSTKSYNVAKDYAAS